MSLVRLVGIAVVGVSTIACGIDEYHSYYWQAYDDVDSELEHNPIRVTLRTTSRQLTYDSTGYRLSANIVAYTTAVRAYSFTANGESLGSLAASALRAASAIANDLVPWVQKLGGVVTVAAAVVLIIDVVIHGADKTIEDDAAKRCQEYNFLCIQNPWQPAWNQKDYGARMQCEMCLGECLGKDGEWPWYKCPLGDRA